MFAEKTENLVMQKIKSNTKSSSANRGGGPPSSNCRFGPGGPGDPQKLAFRGPNKAWQKV